MMGFAAAFPRSLIHLVVTISLPHHLLHREFWMFLQMRRFANTICQSECYSPNDFWFIISPGCWFIGSTSLEWRYTRFECFKVDSWVLSVFLSSHIQLSDIVFNGLCQWPFWFILAGPKICLPILRGSLIHPPLNIEEAWSRVFRVRESIMPAESFLAT